MKLLVVYKNGAPVTTRIQESDIIPLLKTGLIAAIIDQERNWYAYENANEQLSWSAINVAGIL